MPHVHLRWLGQEPEAQPNNDRNGSGAHSLAAWEAWRVEFQA
jgi:hypothetical protein